ncbi:MAG: RHS repeat-associated core domain-containing protein [Candidatus Riflebacteria bacterium]|nr:RHS repeat-associated core domain-containing protein [Candidatus Riflebacteria bacterium]
MLTRWINLIVFCCAIVAPHLAAVGTSPVFGAAVVDGEKACTGANSASCHRGALQRMDSGLATSCWRLQEGHLTGTPARLAFVVVNSLGTALKYDLHHHPPKVSRPNETAAITYRDLTNEFGGTSVCRGHRPATGRTFNAPRSSAREKAGLDTHAYAYDPDSSLLSVTWIEAATLRYDHDDHGRRGTLGLAGARRDPRAGLLSLRIRAYSPDLMRLGDDYRMQSVTTPDTTASFHWAFGNIVSEMLGVAQDETFTLSLPELDSPVERGPPGNPAAHETLLTDPLMTAIAAVDDTGTVIRTTEHLAYGSVKPGSADAGVIGFAGARRDPRTGLLFLRNRVYSPELMRFLSRDPIGFQGGQWNLYGYVGNNPVGRRDPIGLYDWEQFKRDADAFDKARMDALPLVPRLVGGLIGGTLQEFGASRNEVEGLGVVLATRGAGLGPPGGWSSGLRSLSRYAYFLRRLRGRDAPALACGPGAMSERELLAIEQADYLVELLHGSRRGLVGGEFSFEEALLNRSEFHLTGREPAICLTDDFVRAATQYATPRGQVTRVLLPRRMVETMRQTDPFGRTEFLVRTRDQLLNANYRILVQGQRDAILEWATGRRP